MNTDSIHADPRLGIALLPALALRNDLKQVPNKLEDNLFHCSSLIVKVSVRIQTPEFILGTFPCSFLICFTVILQVGQSMLKLHDQVVELNGSTKKYKRRTEAAIEKVQTVESKDE